MNIVIYSDGTGQRGGLLFDERRTNVYKLFRATRCGPDSSVNPAAQLTFYDPGLGTAPAGRGGSNLFANTVRRLCNLVSQTTGLGLTQNIIDCYAATIRMWRPGDRIFLIGFSRGAYTVRCLSVVISMCGVPTRDGDAELKRGEKNTRQIAKEAVKKIYKYTEPRKEALSNRDKELLAQREELARRFRERYSSANPSNPGKANVYPHFIGVFDAVASLAKPIVALSMYVTTILTVVVLAWFPLGWVGLHFGFWKWFGMSALFAVVIALISSVRYEFGLPRKRFWLPFHFKKLNMEVTPLKLSAVKRRKVAVH
jgi:uncharacterized protein (DUF2235 family)